MIEIITAILFIALSVSIPTTIALMCGMKFAPTDTSCPEEVRGVKINILAIKIVVALCSTAMLVALILIQLI